MRRDDWREGNTQKIQRKPQDCNLHLDVEMHHNARDAGSISRCTECSIRVIRRCSKETGEDEVESNAYTTQAKAKATAEA